MEIVIYCALGRELFHHVLDAQSQASIFATINNELRKKKGERERLATRAGEINFIPLHKLCKTPSRVMHVSPSQLEKHALNTFFHLHFALFQNGHSCNFNFSALCNYVLWNENLFNSNCRRIPLLLRNKATASEKGKQQFRNRFRVLFAVCWHGAGVARAYQRKLLNAFNNSMWNLMKRLPTQWLQPIQPREEIVEICSICFVSNLFFPFLHTKSIDAENLLNWY